MSTDKPTGVIHFNVDQDGQYLDGGLVFDTQLNIHFDNQAKVEEIISNLQQQIINQEDSVNKYYSISLLGTDKHLHLKAI